jgi:hypothetical protein
MTKGSAKSFDILHKNHLEISKKDQRVVPFALNGDKILLDVRLITKSFDELIHGRWIDGYINRRQYYTKTVKQQTMRDVLVYDLRVRLPQFERDDRAYELLNFVATHRLLNFHLDKDFVINVNGKYYVLPFFLIHPKTTSNLHNITKLFDESENIFAQHLCNLLIAEKISLDTFVIEMKQFRPSSLHESIPQLIVDRTQLPAEIAEDIYPRMKFDFHSFGITWINHPPLKMEVGQHVSAVVYKKKRTRPFGLTWGHIYFTLFMLTRYDAEHHNQGVTMTIDDDVITFS